MSPLGTIQHSGHASVPVELSTLSSGALAELQPLKQIGDETEAQHSLLDINQAWEQMQEARSFGGRHAVAPALERYTSATHFRSGEPIPADLRACMAPLGTPKWAILFLSFMGLYQAFCAAFSVDSCLHDTDSTCGDGGGHGHGSWLCYAMFPLGIMSFIGVAVWPALHCGLLCVESPLRLVECCRTFSALYLLRCEDMCHHGSPDEIVHRIKTSSCMYTVYGDGSIQMRKLVNLPRWLRSSRSAPPPGHTSTESSPEVLRVS